MSYYKDIFTFPVRDYYEKAGFDFSKEDFKVPADQFIETYNVKVNDAPLHRNVEDTLEYFKSRGVRQFIVSAMKHEDLNASVVQKQINAYFEGIRGIQDHYANSKVDNALKAIKTHNVDPNECILIGDTIHDYEVAEKIGCKCILIAAGHQSRKRLETTGQLVIDHISELKNGI